MSDHGSPTSGSSRRELLAATALVTGGGAALLVASCGGGGDSKSKRVETVSTTQMQADAAVLGALLDLERGALAGYALASEKLRGDALAMARSLAGQEREHAAALERAIRSVGSAPAPPRPRAEYLATFPRLRGDRDALSFALDLETTAVAAYADALPKIATDAVRVTAASILNTEAQHAAVVLGALGRDQVPQPFVTGPPPAERTG